MDINLKFTRVWFKGYNPQEVDAVCDEYEKQLADNKKYFRIYNDKIRQIAEITEGLEKERAKESLRITDLLNRAEQISEQIEQEAKQNAEEIEHEARQKAEEIVAQAQQEAEKIILESQECSLTTQNTMSKIKDNIDVIRKNIEQQLAASALMLNDLETRISGALNEIPKTEPKNVPATLPPNPETKLSDANPYTAFVRSVASNTSILTNQGIQKRDSAFIGHFGD